jgi:two-component system response regulator VicR
MKVLVIDDDKNILELIVNAFEVAWPEAIVLTANSGLEGIRLVDLEKPDTILLDLGLPDVSGYVVAQKIRQISETPIMIISARDEESNIVKALNLGADEYLTKPFGQLELVARIKAMNRRIVKKDQDKIISFRSLSLMPNSNELQYNDRIFRLSNTEKTIMYRLIENKGQVVTNHELAVLFWGPNTSGGEQAIKAYIYRLRQKVEKDYHNPQIILTQSGVGYYLGTDI